MGAFQVVDPYTMTFLHFKGRTLRSMLSHVRTGSVFMTVLFAGLGTYAIMTTQAHSGGITGQTQKSTSAGCSCHCTSSNSGTTVSLSTGSGTSPITLTANQTITFTATVSNSSENDGGIDIATYSGSGLTPGSDGLQNGISPNTNELTHTAPKAFSGNSCTWTFTYTSGSSAGWDTIYATGNAVNGDGSNDFGNCTDKWNNAPKFIIHVVVPTKRMAVSRNAVSFGQIRVGRRVADSLLVTSNGDQAITISSSSMKSGVEFSNYPTTSNRSISTGSTEMDSVIFSPNGRGTFNDSLIYLTNSDTVPNQHVGVYVSGQGIQAIFNATSGTTMAFGNVRVNRTSQQTFSFSNSGDDTLFLQTPTISGNGFAIVSGPTSKTLAPSQSASMVVAFMPTAKQSYSATLNFSASNSVSTPTVSLTGNGVQPQLQISNLIGLGPERVGQILQGMATFKNGGNDTLHLSNASLTQPSSIFNLVNYDQTILPGATGTFHISYNPNGEKTDSATLHFISDDPNDSSVTVTITGTGVLPHMSVAQKGDTVDLGQVKVNSSSTQEFAVTDNGGADLTLSNVTASPSPFSVQSSPNVVVAGSTSYITVKFAPVTTGTFNGTLVIAGDDSYNASDTIYLKGSGINSSLTITPPNVDFGAVPVTTTVTDTITLNNTGGALLNIARYQLSPTGGAFAIVDSSSHQVSANNTAKIRVSFRPDSAISYSGTLTLTTDDANTPTRTISLSGHGVKGALSIVPSSVDFGSLIVGHDSSVTLMLKNTGQASVSIASAAFSGPGASAFSDGPFTTPATVTAGDSTPVNVTFTPTAAGSYQGMLHFTLGDGTNMSVALSGQASSGAGVTAPGSWPFSLTLSPNPANNSIVLHATLTQVSETHIEIFNADGQPVVTQDLGTLAEGTHDILLSVGSLASGTYFVRIGNAAGGAAGARMIVQH